MEGYWEQLLATGNDSVSVVQGFIRESAYDDVASRKEEFIASAAQMVQEIRTVHKARARAARHPQLTWSVMLSCVVTFPSWIRIHRSAAAACTRCRPRRNRK